MKKIAVVLAGCGHRDGSELTEAVSTLIALTECKIEYHCFAPNIEIEVTDHLSGKTGKEKRLLLTEAARIARGKIEDLKLLKSNNFDGLVFPGGFGVALHLCDFAKNGAQAKVLPIIESTIRDFFNAKKPIGAICIAPVLIALVLGKEKTILTIGNDQKTATEIEKTGAKHQICAATDFVVDTNNKIFSTPAFMCAKNNYEVFIGINKMIKDLVEYT